MVDKTSRLITVAKDLGSAMLSNPSIMNPHLENNPDDDEIVGRSIRMAEQLIKEAEERVKA